jgi:hypothetical protein
MDPAIARLVATFSQSMSMTLGSSCRRRGRKPPGQGASENVAPKCDDDGITPVRIADHLWDDPSSDLRFLVEKEDGGRRWVKVKRKDFISAWLKAFNLSYAQSQTAIALWPNLVLDFYLAHMQFGPHSHHALGGGGAEADDAEAAELRRIAALLEAGSRFRREGQRPARVDGIIRLKPDGEVLVLVQFTGNGAQGLLPVRVCAEEMPGLLLEFLHADLAPDPDPMEL